MGGRPFQRAWPAALVAMIAAVVWLQPAIGADLPSPGPAPSYLPPAPAPNLTPQTVNSTDGSDIFDPRSFQLRFGAFAHGVGGVEQGTYDLSPEIVFPQLLPFGQGQWWSVLIPRPHVGGLINLEGKTSSAYGGALWTFPLPHRFFAELFLDGDKYWGYESNPPLGRSGLGCPYLFHDGGNLGYKVSDHWSVMFSFDHQSNGHGIFGIDCDGMGSNTRNPGINDYGLRVGYTF
jgi:lipid A 3-O-deacylase